jgi:outer membrane protein assembly factor BamA
MRTLTVVFLALSVFGASLCVQAQDAQTTSSPNKATGSPFKPGKKYIRKITVKIGEIFEDQSGTLYSLANSVKVSTMESVIRTEMLFKEGDEFDPYLVRQTARNLRLQRYLRDIKVVPTFDGDAVDILVSARDSWTLIPFLSYSSGTGQRNRGIGLSEGNFGGGATRVDTRYQEQASRKTYALAVSDPQFLGTRKNFTAGFADRSDGQVYQAGIGLPFRHLMQQDSWAIDYSQQNTIGRLFEGGEETYIFRQHLDDFNALYTFAGKGAHPAQADDPYTGIFKGQTVLSQRYSVGWGYQSASFYQADQGDYEDLDLDPTTVSNDPADLASNRRFSGPMVQYQNIQPEFISMNYIDRFDRVEDYNLGDESLLNMLFSPRSLGSLENSFLVNANRSRGWRFSERSFLRGEVGGASRFDKDQLNNTLLRAEAKYYSVLGDYFIGDRYFGRHTIASQFFLDFGEDLDKDRQLLLGAENSLRGYEVNTFEGDKRMALTLEERAHIADDVFQLVSVGTALFVDVGGATRDTLASIVTDDLYGDVGFGFRFCFPRASGGGVVRMDIALPLRDGPDGSKAWEPRVVFAAGQLFGARLRSEQVGAENASSGVGFDR